MKRTAAFVMVTLTVMLGTDVTSRGAPASPASADAAAADRTQRVCRDRVSLRHAPAGVRVGYLYRGDRVIVVLYARRKRWAYVISTRGNAWLLTRALCR